MPVKPETWPVGREKRVSVNSFGIGGSNAHVSTRWLCSSMDVLHIDLLILDRSSWNPHPTLSPRRTRCPCPARVRLRRPGFWLYRPTRRTRCRGVLGISKPTWNGFPLLRMTWPTRLLVTVRVYPIGPSCSPAWMGASWKRRPRARFSAHALPPSRSSVARERSGPRWGRNCSRRMSASKETWRT